MKRSSVIILMALVLCSCSGKAVAPVISVNGGKLQGVLDSTGKVLVYKGIPYAMPPVGTLRWAEPQPAEPWDSVKVCDKFGPAAMQGALQEGTLYWKEFYNCPVPEKSEDCLYLNVWAPASKTPGGYPVAVWIHGGAFMQGYGHEMEFDGENFAKKGVILVTINYRLGIFGYLALDELEKESKHHTTGNYGLLDQYTALKWVKDNIERFGGDSRRITVFGQSAGAGSVQDLISSKMCKGIVTGAIIQSGGGLRGIIDVPTKEEHKMVGAEFLKFAGLKDVAEARTLSADSLMKLAAGFSVKQGMGFQFTPCVDDYILKASPNAVALAENELDINYMIGYCANDIAPDVMKSSAANWSLLLEKQGRKPAYVYCFSRALPGDESGAFHSSELWYVFGTLNRCWRPMTEADYALSDKISDYWANFFKYGNPNGDHEGDWKPYTSGENYIETLDIAK
jgi:para-nitrobenzyl esterase